MRCIPGKRGWGWMALDRRWGAVGSLSRYRLDRVGPTLDRRWGAAPTAFTGSARHCGFPARYRRRRNYCPLLSASFSLGCGKGEQLKVT